MTKNESKKETATINVKKKGVVVNALTIEQAEQAVASPKTKTDETKKK